MVNKKFYSRKRQSNDTITFRKYCSITMKKTRPVFITVFAVDTLLVNNSPSHL